MEKIDSEGAFGAVFNKGCDFACEVKRMADAENKGSGSGGQDIGRNETEEIAVVILHFYTQHKGDYKSDKAKDINNMAEALELWGFLFIVEKGLDIVGKYSTTRIVDENHFIEIDREGGEMTYELAIYRIDKDRFEAKHAEAEAALAAGEEGASAYTTDTLNGYSKSKAAKDDALIRIGTGTAVLDKHTGERISLDVQLSWDEEPKP